MADSADDAQFLQERALADVLAHRQTRPEAPAPKSNDCTRCGDPIEPDRRRLLPSTNLCAVCAKQLDKGGS